jgi:hypothetical protein
VYAQGEEQMAKRKQQQPSPAEQVDEAKGYARSPSIGGTGSGTLVATSLQCEAMGAAFRLEASPTVERLLEAIGVRDLVHGRVESPHREDRESA